MNIHLKIEHSREIDEWIRQHHYLGTVPAGAVLRMRFIDDATGETVGGMLWGRNPSPKQDQYNQLCLTRMYFVDNTERYIESHALSMARKYIRKHMPKIKGVVAYSSTGACHEGIVYQADGWFTERLRHKLEDFLDVKEIDYFGNAIQWEEFVHG